MYLLQTTVVHILPWQARIPRQAGCNPDCSGCIEGTVCHPHLGRCLHGSFGTFWNHWIVISTVEGDGSINNILFLWLCRLRLSEFRGPKLKRKAAYHALKKQTTDSEQLPSCKGVLLKGPPAVPSQDQQARPAGLLLESQAVIESQAQDGYNSNQGIRQLSPRF